MRDMRGVGGSGSEGAAATGRPNLEKPLEDLTHQDIMHLTREDCRRYLKQKGMRRPSWNKSQAIQQVLSLKNLFDSRPDDARKSTNEIVKESASISLLQSPELERVPVSSNSKYLETMKLEWLTEAQLPVLANQPPTIGRQNCVLNSCKQTGAQLTIFYSGNVNVYNDVPAEKAQAIMLLAGGANDFPPSSPITCQNILHTNISLNNGMRTSPATCSLINTQIHKETPLTRKASLQRFLEKKKDRSRCKTSGGSSKKPPLLMGMFMHPSFVQRQYWTEPAKKKPTKPNASPTRPPQTPSSDEQALTCPTRKSDFDNSNEEDLSLHKTS